MINFVKVQVIDPEAGMSDFLSRVLKSKGIEDAVTEISKEESNEIKEKTSLDVIKMRQLEQKQELLVGLTNLLFKKFEEIQPTKKFSKFEFTDISWYKKLGTA
jgi:chemotaxis response regulator CheB